MTIHFNRLIEAPPRYKSPEKSYFVPSEKEVRDYAHKTDGVKAVKSGFQRRDSQHYSLTESTKWYQIRSTFLRF